MGLRDVLNGMMNGPRGQRQPSTGGNAKGVPRIIWAPLAYKAFKGDDGQAAPTDPGNPSDPSPPPRRWL
jgi:hypothetical protein